MEGNLPPRALIPGSPFDLEPSMQRQQFHFPQPQEDAADGHHDHGKVAAAAGASQWHRVKWTSDMVKLLVSAVAYIDEDVEADHGSSSGRRKHAMLKKKGKWKLVSMAMNERGFAVGRACEIVEKPALLEKINLSAKLKEEAKKHLNSKHLHYEEMCSYHNRNRFCLLDDPSLQKSLRMALRSGEEQGKKNSFGYEDNDDQVSFSDDDDEDDECNDYLEVSAEDRHHRVHHTKKLKHDHEEMHCGSHLSEVAVVDMNKMFSEGSGGTVAEKNLNAMHSNQIEQERLKIKAQMLKIEQRHFKWLRFSKEKDRELEKMRLENEKMALENERFELELKLKEIEMGIKPKRIW
ncbi:hypothetical protein PR202_gb08726 [Eleusine coracana subsp. coracana]|uniref:Uncharacterized protein n=1 Tax=Eleusine coracana subsp. coracana TaxID=191504 RepID=A0AAV5EFX7_ELECO|nr:hypothetical protein PR202_gb08726 [Eleusine coracana subsp. coracana]